MFFDARLVMADWHGNLSFLRDYIYLGYSKNRGNPLVQGQIDYQHESGWFGGLAASQVRFDDVSNSERAEIEIKPFLGWSADVLSNIRGELSVSGYLYDNKDHIVVAALPGHHQPGGFPANIPGVIAVGQVDEAEPSGIVAPDRDILTTVPHEAYDFMTGSSFATSHIAGLAALILQKHPDWQVSDIKQQLRSPENALSALQSQPAK